MAGDLYRRLARLLRDAGCEPKRQGKGGHEIWSSPLTNRAFSVPVNIISRPLATRS